MSSDIPSPSTNSLNSPPQILLVPWDPASPAHVERLVQQRHACGWDWEHIETWKEKQSSGLFNLQWLVLDPSDPLNDAKLLSHTSKYPEEATPITDSALSYGGKPRSIPEPQKSFIPIGHICLGSVSLTSVNPDYFSPDFAETGWFWISNFYVSRALQGSGLGRAAMDTVEGVAIGEPLNARVLALNAICKVDGEREEKYGALGLVIPPFSNQEWYERRGYKVYKDVDKAFSKVDSAGKVWYWNAVCLKKEI